MGMERIVLVVVLLVLWLIVKFVAMILIDVKSVVMAMEEIHQVSA